MAQTLRLDVALEVGAAAESITVVDEVTLLRTESGEMSTNVPTQRVNDLPILNVNLGQGAAAMRSPYASVQLAPGTYWNNNNALRVNGVPANTQALRIEGQDSTNGLWALTPAMTQPSVDAIQETAIQTSNYAAEFGQAGGGVFNVTVRSGTNDFHGSAYEYFVNEALHAQVPFQNVRPQQRRHDYGFTFGGPILRDRTFFFWNWEWFRDNTNNNNIPQTVPTEAYRRGDFSAALRDRVIGTDALGREIREGQIFDPASQRTVVVGGQSLIVRDPFAGNIIPEGRLDPVAQRIQSFIPLPNRPGLFNNYVPSFVSTIRNNIPAVKIDHQVTTNGKLSGYWSRTKSDSVNLVGFGQADGLPRPITGARGSFLDSNTIRLNYDHTLSPTMLLHFGAGLVRFEFEDNSPETEFDPATTLGLHGIPEPNGRFPRITGLLAANNTGGGPTNGFGPLAQSLIKQERPTGNASLTWVRGNHTFKFGGETIIDGYPSRILAASVGVFNFSAESTSHPALIGTNTSGTTAGFPYASFLLGAVNSGNIGRPAVTRLGWHSISGFAQDSWKVTRRLTLDYGLRYDYQTYLREGNGLMPSFGFDTPNPAAGGRPGALIFEGDGPGRCGCDFAQNYPHAWGPRVGGAYQLDDKTVARAGFGIVYSKTGNNSFTSQFISSNNDYSSPGQYVPATFLREGVPITPVWPNFDPGQQPSIPGSLGTVGVGGIVDRNAGRPARQLQWSASIQREIFRNLVVEGGYIGNRGAWWQANQLVDYNRLTPEILASVGLSLDNPAHRALLTSPISSPAVQNAGFRAPYSTFSPNNTLAQALRPYPHFGALNTRWAPLGRTWYDAFQAKVTKRLSYGLDFTYTFTYQREFTLGAESEDNSGFAVAPAVNDVLNRDLNKYISGFSQPFQNVLALNYTTPRVEGVNRWLSAVLSDWTVGAVLSYRSGLPIRAPMALNNLQQQLAMQSTSFQDRVPGQPFFLVDLNDEYDPNKTDPRVPGNTPVLNPAAWTTPPPGKFGSAAAYYNDYRYQRRPQENLSLGRNFRIHEGMSLNIRAEFTNVLNRTQPNNPSSLNTGNLFGFINTGTVFSPPRQGTIVGRFVF